MSDKKDIINSNKQKKSKNKQQLTDDAASDASPPHQVQKGWLPTSDLSLGSSSAALNSSSVTNSTSGLGSEASGSGATSSVLGRNRSRLSSLALKIKTSLPAETGGLGVGGGAMPTLPPGTDTNVPVAKSTNKEHKNKDGHHHHHRSGHARPVGMEGRFQHRFAITSDSVPAPSGAVQAGLSPGSPLLVQVDLNKDCFRIGKDANPVHKYYLGVVNAGQDARYITVQVVNPQENSTLFLALGPDNYHGHDLFDYGQMDDPFEATGTPMDSFGKRAIPRTHFRNYLTPTNVEFFNGIELERFLFNHSDLNEVCADTMGSREWLDFVHQYSELYLVHKLNDRGGLPEKMSKFVMEMRDCGIRTRRGPSPVHEFWKDGSSDEAFKAAHEPIEQIKMYLVYPNRCQTIDGAYVLLLNDLKPVPDDKSMTYIFGLSAGCSRMYSQQLYHNVTFMTMSGDKRMSELARHLFKLCDQERTFSTIKVRDETYWTLRTDFKTPEPLHLHPNCSKLGPPKQIMSTRGLYNDFWSRVADPEKEKDDQPELIVRWRQMYRAQFAHRGLHLARAFEHCRRDKLNVVTIKNLRDLGKLQKVSVHNATAEVRFLSGRTHADILQMDKTLQSRYPRVAMKMLLVQLDGSFGGNNIMFDFEGMDLLAEDETLDNVRKATELFNNFYTMQAKMSEVYNAPVNSSTTPITNEFHVPTETLISIYFVNYHKSNPFLRIGVKNVPKFVACFTVHCEVLGMNFNNANKLEQAEALRAAGHPLFDVQFGYPLDGFYKFDGGWRHEIVDKRARSSLASQAISSS